jgi:alcohol-forming fatty acyl-CoA reductase
LKIPLKQLVDETPKLIKGYPNTYTFTKALCERIIKKRKGDECMCIVRPAIINTSYSEPYPGWMDSIAAAAALFLFSGLGVIKEVFGCKWLIGDMIPVDIVVANIIVAAAFNMKQNKKLNIYHVGSSDRNPITWKECETITVDYWKSNISQSRLAEPTVFMTNNPLHIKINRLRKRFPVWMYAKVAPYMGKNHVKKVHRVLNGFQRADEIQSFFTFFMTNEWIYESRNMKEFNNFLSSD